jgi:metal-responsive CopG/Arc/MetJ family transcriptional regulator
MNKMKNYKIPITTTLEVELVQKLDEYVKETGVSKTDVINEALREYLERQEKKN